MVRHAITRLLPGVALLATWAMVRADEFALVDPAILLLPTGMFLLVLGLASVTRFWKIRQYAQSRREELLK